jgi:hypothetical protein
MEIDIYYTDRHDFGRDVLADALTEEFGLNSYVTGGGSGNDGSNIDLLVNDDSISLEKALANVRKVLTQYGLSASASIVIDGKKHTLEPISLMGS